VALIKTATLTRPTIAQPPAARTDTRQEAHTKTMSHISTVTPIFSELGLNPKLLEALAQQGYTSPTPIQAQAFPFC